MDILRKELNSIYLLQNLEAETLPRENLEYVKRLAGSVVKVGEGCAVVTDISCDHCYIYSGNLGDIMGFACDGHSEIEINSSDEDIIYTRIHPEDIVDKRFLEYEFFKAVHSADEETRLSLKATCRLRMKDRSGNYRIVDNSTQLMKLSPAGKMWLVLCLYDLSPMQNPELGIAPNIINRKSGVVIPLSFDARRRHVLTGREKEILLLIKEGKPSKQIADILGISINTVNRHRQNIIAKLSVGNSIEAISAAVAMRLL